jgi:hypothetical protein
LKGRHRHELLGKIRQKHSRNVGALRRDCRRRGRQQFVHRSPTWCRAGGMAASGAVRIINISGLAALQTGATTGPILDREFATTKCLDRACTSLQMGYEGVSTTTGVRTAAVTGV